MSYLCQIDLNHILSTVRKHKATNMKKTILFLIVLISTLFTNCKKEYVCECFNPGGVFQTYSIKDTKKKAAKKCADYSKQYQGVAWSETGCT